MFNLNKFITIAKHDIGLFNKDLDLAVYIAELLERAAAADKGFAQELEDLYSEIQSHKESK